MFSIMENVFAGEAATRNLGVEKTHKIPDESCLTNRIGNFYFGLPPMIFNVPYKILNESRDNGDLKALAVFLRLKKIYSNIKK